MPIPGYLCGSISPAGGATGNHTRENIFLLISIHAPRMGSDDAAKQSPRSVPHFNPHSPHGERPRRRKNRPKVYIFQSTLPAWGATYRLNVIPRKQMYFNPRPPHGERHSILESNENSITFQSTLPHGERLKKADNNTVLDNFNPHSRMGSDYRRR